MAANSSNYSNSFPYESCHVLYIALHVINVLAVYDCGMAWLWRYEKIAGWVVSNTTKMAGWVGGRIGGLVGMGEGSIG